MPSKMTNYPDDFDRLLKRDGELFAHGPSRSLRHRTLESIRSADQQTDPVAWLQSPAMRLRFLLGTAVLMIGGGILGVLAWQRERAARPGSEASNIVALEQPEPVDATIQTHGRVLADWMNASRWRETLETLKSKEILGEPLVEEWKAIRAVGLRYFEDSFSRVPPIFRDESMRTSTDA